MPDFSDTLPLEFFMNPKCPPARAPIEATTTEEEKRKMVEKAKEPEGSSHAKDFAETS